MVVKADVVERNARLTRWIAAVVISGVVGSHGARANQPALDDDGMKLGKLSTIALALRRPPDAAQTARIKRLIGSLVNISTPDFGSISESKHVFRGTMGLVAAGWGGERGEAAETSDCGRFL